jgi:hypothetical protein
MKRKLASAIAFLVGLGLAGAGIAQGRQDEKPHGYDKAKAEAAAKDTPKPQAQSAAGGRHDEKPHGVKQTKSAPKTMSKPTDGNPAPEAAAAAEAKKVVQ